MSVSIELKSVIKNLNTYSTTKTEDTEDRQLNHATSKPDPAQIYDQANITFVKHRHNLIIQKAQ